MVRVFYTPLGHRNTTRFLFEKAAENSRHPDYSKILYLAPTSIKVEDAQKIFHQLQDNRCYIPPEMATISRYSKKLYSAFGSERVLSRPLIQLVLSGLAGKGLGFSSVTADFISDLKQLYPDKGIDEIRLDFRDVFYMLNIPDTVTGVVMDALDTFKAYQSFIRNNGLLDEDDLIKVCPRYIKDIKDSNEMGALIIDGFYNPTVAEKNVLRELIHNYKHTFIAMPYDPAFYGLTKDYIEFLKENALIEEALLDKDISDISSVLNYYSYPDIEEEVEGIARNIKALYVSGKVKALEEISVVFPELNDYSAMVERIFRRYGIPYNILMRKSLGGMRPFLDLLCLLSSLAEGYPRLKFSQFLSSNYFSRIPGSLRKWIPLISVQSGIISGKTAWLDFISSGSEVLDISLLPERSSVEKDLNWVFERLQPLEDVKTGATFTTYAMLLKKLLDDFGFPGPLNKPSAKKIFEATNELIAQLSFLGTLNPAPVTLPEFEEALRHLLHASYVETEGNGVRVMDFSGVQGLTPRYLFFGGLSDANMPERQGMDYMLPDNVKMKMGFLHLDKYNLIQKFGFASIIKASEHLHLSYPLMDGDTVFLPSSFLYSGEEVKERLPGIFSKEEYLVRTGNEPLLNYMAEVRVHPSLLRIPSYLRVTDIDAYRACPRRFFIEKILRLTPLSVKEYEIEAATLGTIIHKVMEKLVQEPLKEMEQTETRTGEIIEEILKDKKMDAYWKRLIKDTFIEMLPEIYEKELEIREAGYVSTEVEKSISGEPLKGIKLRGKIDRIDKIGDYVQIIDYKTGTAGLNCTQVLNGNENLQLFLYAAIMKSHGYNVKRVGIYSLKDMNIKWCPPKRGGRGKENQAQVIDDYVIASLRFLEVAVEHMKKGDFTAKPLNDYTCWNCHEYAFCPYIQQ